MIYKLNRDIGEYKKGKIVSVGRIEKDSNFFIDEALFNTWIFLGLLDPVEEGRWKPKNGEVAYYINLIGRVCVSRIWGLDDDKIQVDYGNYFQTREQAEEAAKKVKELLLSLHK